MKLVLKNFRCYTNKTFNFGEKGAVLISGTSGSGKTTILMAINFAIFGQGKKLISNGKSSCEVKLSFNGIQIVRTKKPNGLVVITEKKEEIQDDEAQEYLNSLFGNTFSVCSYLKQENYQSFILMTPLEKLAFIEKFAFQGIDLKRIKNDCKKYTVIHNEKLIKAKSQLELSLRFLSSQEKPKEVKFSKKIIKKSSDLEKEKILREELEREKNRLESELEELNESINGLSVKASRKEAEAESTENSIREQSEYVSEMRKEREEIQCDESLYISLEKRLEEIKSEEKRYSKNMERKYVVESRLEKIKINQRNREDCLTTINRCKAERFSDEKNQEMREELYIRQRFSSLKYQLSEIEKTMVRDDVENRIKEKTAKAEFMRNEIQNQILEGKILKCPSCSHDLSLRKGILVSVDETPHGTDEKKNIEKTSLELVHLEKEIMELNGIKNRKKEIEKELKYKKFPSEFHEADPEEFEKQEWSLNNSITHQSKCFEAIESCEEELEEYPDLSEEQTELFSELSLLKKCKKPADFSENLQKLTEEKEKRKKLKELTSRILRFEKSVSEYSEILSELVRDKESIEKSLLEKKKRKLSLEKNLKKIEQDISEKNDIIKMIDEYNKHISEQKKYDEYVEIAEKMKTEEKRCQEKYSAILQLKKQILETESVSMINIINSINSHAREYLDAFFTVDPITVRLIPFKEGKKETKPQITVQVEYRGMETDLSILSGGELARVSLAYTLALAEITHSNLLLLDECTASLDQELSCTVIDKIRESFKDKLVVIIAHQVVSGIFDKIVQL